MKELEETEGKLLSQEFGVGGPPAAVETRPLAVIEAELDMLKRDTRQKESALLCNYIEVGRRLGEAKSQLPHGQWGDWLKKVGISQSTANNFMRIFREYGADQQSLFGGVAKSQTFGSLTYSKAVLLLAVPEEEREQFLEENDISSMSTRELKAAIKARDEAEEKAAAAEDEAERLRKEADRLQEELEGQAQVYRAKLTSADLETVEAKRKAREALEALEKAKDRTQRLQEALSTANASAQSAEAEHARLTQELEELRSRPAEKDTGAVEAARQAAIDEMTEKVDKAKAARKKAEEKRKAAEESLEAAQKELAELKAKGPEVRELTPEELQALTAGEVEKAREEDTRRLRELEKKLAAADPDVAEFKVRWHAWREAHQKMMDVLGRVARNDGDQAARLREAVKAALEQMAAV